MRKIISLLALACTLSVAAQETLNIEQVRQLALDNNSKAKNAALTTQIAEQAVKQYRANYFPDFSLTGAAAWGSSKKNLYYRSMADANAILAQLAPVIGLPIQLPDLSLDFEMGWILSGGIMMKQPVFMGGRIVAANRIARHSLAMARQNQRLTDTEIIEQADQAYINVVRAYELGEVAKRYHELLTELERNVQSAVDVGMKMPADLLRVQVKKNEVELKMMRAANGVRLATMNLNHVIGRPLSTETRVDTALLVATEASADASALRPEFAIMQEKSAIARQQVNVVRAEALPSVALLARYGYSRGLKINDNLLIDGGSFLGGVTVNIPLFHFGERAAKLRQAKLRAEQAENDLRDVEEKLSLALAKAQNEVNEAQMEVELGSLSVRQAETSMNMTRQQFDNGMATLSDLLDAQALWQQARQTEIDARFNLFVARTSLLKAMGALR